MRVSDNEEYFSLDTRSLEGPITLKAFLWPLDFKQKQYNNDQRLKKTGHYYEDFLKESELGY